LTELTWTVRLTVRLSELMSELYA